MNNIKTIWQSVVVSSVLVLAACGGGSGGGGGGQASGPSLSLDSDNLASKKVAISANMNVDGINQLSTDLNDAFAFVEDLYESLRYQPGGVSGTTDCDAGGTATVTYAGSGENIDERWQFNNCEVATYSHGNVLLNGTFRYVDTLTSSTTTSETWKGYESYDLTGEIKLSGQPLVIKGRVNWDQLFQQSGSSAGGRLVDTIEVFELRVGDQYIAITDSETRLEGTETEVNYSIKGKLIGSAVGGYIQMSTPTPVHISTYETCPTQGVLRIASDGTAEVRFGSSAAGTAGAVAVWVDGQIIESYADCSNLGFTPVY